MSFQASFYFLGAWRFVFHLAIQLAFRSNLFVAQQQKGFPLQSGLEELSCTFRLLKKVINIYAIKAIDYVLRVIFVSLWLKNILKNPHICENK